MPRGYTTRQFTLGNTFGKPKEETKSYISIGLLTKIRHCVPEHLFQTLYYSLFNSHLIMLVKSGDKTKPINSLKVTSATKLFFTFK